MNNKIKAGVIRDEDRVVAALKRDGVFRSGIPRTVETETKKPKAAPFRFLTSKELQGMTDPEDRRQYFRDAEASKGGTR
jgi:hypothetical protein